MYVCNIRMLTYVTYIHSALAVFALCLEPVKLKQSFSQLKSSFYHLVMRTVDTGFPYAKARHSKHIPSLLGVGYCRHRSMIFVFLLQDRSVIFTRMPNQYCNGLSYIVKPISVYARTSTQGQVQYLMVRTVRPRGAMVSPY